VFFSTLHKVLHIKIDNKSCVLAYKAVLKNFSAKKDADIGFGMLSADCSSSKKAGIK